MKTISAVLLAALAAVAFGGYTYYFTDPMTSLQTSYWTSSGSPQFTSFSGYWGAYSPTGSVSSSMVSKVAVPDGTSSYDVTATVRFPNGVSNGGSLYLLLRSNSTFSSSGSTAGMPTNAYIVQFYCNPSSSFVSVSKIINGSVTVISSGSGITCSDGMTVRSAITDNGQIVSYVNDASVEWAQDTSITSGAPGIVLPEQFGSSTNMVVSQVQLGPADRIAPGPIPTNGLTYSVYSNHIDFQWQAVPDDANGTGVCLYQFLRDDQWTWNTSTLSWSDTTVQPGIEYSYTFIAFDRFFNFVSQTVTITVPPLAGAPPTPSDGRRVGVRSTGAYWGAAPEQIDVLSGNVSYAVPLLKAQARTGWSVGFNLAYNSQNWRQDSGGPWNFGEDVGYGYGWKLLAGSVTPIWANQYTFSYYSFVDSTGAEYRLNQNNSGIWTSVESVYVTFNANTNTLYFRDGSFWVMGCTSATTEPDSGTLYPTTIEDTNGNQIMVTYRPGAGLGGTNSSARISQIQDVRGLYLFNYNTDSPNHLTSITNTLSTPEAYSFNYGSLSLQAPFSPYTNYGSVATLNTITFSTTAQTYNLGYSTDNSGSLQYSYLPTGGVLGWSYQNVTYGNGATYREVSLRGFSKDGVNYTFYPFTYGSSPGYSTNQNTVIDDPGGVGEKYWAFSQTGVNTGMVTQFQGRQLPGPVTKTQNDFTWTQDNVGNLYIGSTLTSLDPGQSYQVQKKTDQTVDIYGNVLKVFQYDYNSLTTPSRVYTYTYLNSSAYTSRYIYNRLTQATLGVGNQNVVTLATNTYDGGSFVAAPPGTTNWDATYATVSTRGDATSYTSINDVGSTIYDRTGNVTGTTVDGVTTQVTSSAATNYAAPSQLSVGGLTSSMDWNPSLNITGATGPNGDSSTIAYDPAARPMTSTSPYGAVTSYTYSSGPNSAGNPMTTTATTNGHWTKTILDGLGRTLTVQTGDASGTKSQTDTVYGSCGCSPTGKMIQQSLPYAPGGTPAWTTYTYDGIGRTISVVAPDGASTTTYLYQGNTVKVTDPAGKWKIFTMDAFGHLTLVDEPNPGSGPPPPLPVSPPTFSPAPGTYGSSQSVTLSSTSGASIRFTTDGSTPSETNGTLYTLGFVVSSNASIKAIAYETGMADSAIASVTYTISSGGSGPAWYNSGWSYRKAITISSSQVSGSLSNFPVLISVTDSNLAASAQSSGNDILFTASDGQTKLNHEIETYTSSSGLLNAWVSVSSLSHGTNTVIYMYYGNGSAGSQQNATSVWSGNYVGVYHFPNGTTLSANDSTGNAANGTITGVAATIGMIGGAGSFSGSGGISVPSMNIATAVTASAWVYSTNYSQNMVVISRGVNSDWQIGFFSACPSTGLPCLAMYGADGYGGAEATPPTNGAWHYIAGTISGTTASVYIDGVLLTTHSTTAITNSGIAEYIGSFENSFFYFNGSIDEARIANTALSPSWIATEYNNQSSPGTFFSVGGAQTQGGGGSYPTPVGMPTFSPAPGTYNASQTVAISSSTSGASIRYTTDGTAPSETAGTLYTGAITLSSTVTIRAIAYAPGMADSELSSGAFTILTSSGGGDYLTTYTYDAWDNLNQVSMPRSSGTQTRTFTYNGKQLLTATNPENGTVTYTYNSYNKVATKTDAKGQAVVYTYDTIARLTKVQRYPTGTSGSEDTCQQENYTYDTSLNSTYSVYSQGRLTGVQYSGGFTSGGACPSTFTETYGYSLAGQKTNKGLLVTRTFTAEDGNGNDHTGPATADLESAYAYDSEGRMTSIQYPGSTAGSGPAGPNFTYAYDTMGRLNTMTNVATSYEVISGATYDPANRLLSLAGNLTESRVYNTMGQLTQLTSSAFDGNSLNITYNYSSTQNNGKIVSQTDNLSGEQVVYAYDALNRLMSAGATNSSWGQSYDYDGFGNLTNQNVTAGTAPSLSVAYNASTNRQTTDCTDANGNILGGTLSGGSCSGQLYSYDVANRMHPLTGSYYSYAPGNKRVWRGAMDNSGNITLDEVTFWSVTGQRLATYNLSQTANLTTTVLTESLAVSRTYFGGRLIANGTGNVATDRLGSIGKYYPWGQVKPSGNVVGTEGFTGYFRDSETGLDYAINRYHQPGMGRFLTVDRKRRSARPTSPGSWNRYAYAGGDPINRVDRKGLDDDGLQIEDSEDPCDPTSEAYDPAECGGGSGEDPPDPVVTPFDIDSLGDGLTQALVAPFASDQCVQAIGANSFAAITTALNMTTFQQSSASGYTSNGNGTATVVFGVESNTNDTITFNQVLLNPTASVLSGFAESYGLTGVTADQLQAIYLLHELGHIIASTPALAGSTPLLNDMNADGTPNLTNSNANTQTIIDNCFSFLKGN